MAGRAPRRIKQGRQNQLPALGRVSTVRRIRRSIAILFPGTGLRLPLAGENSTLSLKITEKVLILVYAVYTTSTESLVSKRVLALRKKNRRTPGVRQLVNGARRYF